MSSRMLVPAAVLALAAAAVAADTPKPGLYGQISGDVYTAPGGVYSVSIPVLPEFGGQVHDTETVVTFDDSVNTHASIACFPLDMTQKWEFETRGIRDYLAYFFANYVLPDFQARYPGASSEKAVFVPAFLDGSLIAYCLLPGGSAFENRDSVIGPPAGELPVAKRGNLLFVRTGYIYVVSIELAERITQRSVFNKTPDQENEILRERLLQLASRIHFPAPKPAPK